MVNDACGTLLFIIGKTSFTNHSSPSKFAFHDNPPRKKTLYVFLNSRFCVLFSLILYVGNILCALQLNAFRNRVLSSQTEYTMSASRASCFSHISVRWLSNSSIFFLIPEYF